MVRVGLQISASFENVEELKTNYPEYPFFLKLTCTNCGETSEKWHDIIESERTQHNTRCPDGFNFYMKCKMCSRENTIDIVEKSNCAYTQDDAGKYKTIVIFDCRGVEPVEFSPRTGWIVRSIDNGEVFENVDLSEDDWVDYDQKNKNSRAILHMFHTLEYITKIYTDFDLHVFFYLLFLYFIALHKFKGQLTL